MNNMVSSDANVLCEVRKGWRDNNTGGRQAEGGAAHLTVTTIPTPADFIQDSCWCASVYESLVLWYLLGSPRLMRLRIALLMEIFCLNKVYLHLFPVLQLSLQLSSLKLTPWQHDWAKSRKWKLQNCSSTTQGLLEEVDKSNYNNSSPPPRLSQFRKHAVLIPTPGMRKPGFPINMIRPSLWAFLFSFLECSLAYLRWYNWSPTNRKTCFSLIWGFQASGFLSFPLSPAVASDMPLSSGISGAILLQFFFM